MSPNAPPGRIITFYSYKGGTGRSMHLANVAWVLASNGKRVLAVDWDLEAPGLHRFFHPFLLDKELASTPGLIDLVLDYAEWTVTPRKERALAAAASSVEPNSMEQAAPPSRMAADFEEYRKQMNILRNVVSLDRSEFGDKGVLDLMPAGRQGPSYATRINTFDWKAFYERMGGGAFLEAVREQMRTEYDYILIDSRTGLSDTSGICTVQMPDDLVVLFTLNIQSIEGAAAVACSVRAQRNNSEFRIFPVPTRVETGEKDKRELALDHAEKRFASILDEQVSPKQRNIYWGSAQVPYLEYYAFEEVLAPFGDKPDDPLSMLPSATNLTALLTNQIVRGMPSIDEKLRILLKEQYERSRAPRPGLREALAMHRKEIEEANLRVQQAQLTLDAKEEERRAAAEEAANAKSAAEEIRRRAEELEKFAAVAAQKAELQKKRASQVASIISLLVLLVIFSLAGWNIWLENTSSGLRYQMNRTASQLVTRPGISTDAVRAWAKSQARWGNATDAADALSQISDTSPQEKQEKIDALTQVAVTWHDVGQASRAADAMRQASNLNEQQETTVRAEGYITLAGAEIQLGLNEQAATHLQKGRDALLLSKVPLSADSLYQLLRLSIIWKKLPEHTAGEYLINEIAGSLHFNAMFGTSDSNADQAILWAHYGDTKRAYELARRANNHLDRFAVLSQVAIADLSSGNESIAGVIAVEITKEAAQLLVQRAAPAAIQGPLDKNSPGQNRTVRQDSTEQYNSPSYSSQDLSKYPSAMREYKIAAFTKEIALIGIGYFLAGNENKSHELIADAEQSASQLQNVKLKEGTLLAIANA